MTQNNLDTPMNKRGPKAKYIITPEMHVEIKKVYQTMTGNGEVKELASRFGMPRWKIQRYALRQEWCVKSKKEPDWGERELKILEAGAHLTPERIQARLKKAGFTRSLNGIVLKRKRMRFLKNLKGISARSLAICFEVNHYRIDDHCVTTWIEKGFLRAKKRGTNRTERQGGDHWFIRERWVKDFIIENVAILDFRKIDKYWLVDILTGQN